MVNGPRSKLPFMVRGLGNPQFKRSQHNSRVVVMCVPFGRPASRWQRLGRHNWVVMVELTFFVHLMVAQW